MNRPTIQKSTDPVSDYGTFDVYIRKFDDTDEEPVFFEKYLNVSLNPNADRYIARIIGDQNTYFDFDKQKANQKQEGRRTIESLQDEYIFEMDENSKSRTKIK